jgi:hypothetical protein
MQRRPYGKERIIMDAEKWGIVAEKLQRIHGKAFLLCDELRINLVLLQIRQFENAIVVRINGAIPGDKILLNACAERSRFCQKIRKYKYSTSARNKVKKMSRPFQRLIMEKHPGINDRIELFVPYWTSFEKLKNHFERHNKNIRLLNCR